MSIGTKILIHDPTIQGHLGQTLSPDSPIVHWIKTPGKVIFLAALLLQIYSGLLNFIIEVLEMKLNFFWMGKFFVAFYDV